MFMNVAPATAEHAREPAPGQPARGRLLGLVRKLIDFGRDLMATVQARDTHAAPVAIAHRFGTMDAARIIARITRGLMIAAALELRLSRPVPCMGVRPTQPTPARRTSTPRKPRQPRIDEESELLGALPSAREIAARLRKRRPGAVIVEKIGRAHV